MENLEQIRFETLTGSGINLKECALMSYEKSRRLAYRVRRHVAYVKIATPSQIRTALAGNANSDSTMPTSTLAKSVNAVVAVNGDFFTRSTGGYIVRQSETLRKKVSDNYDLLVIDENGDFHLILAGKQNQKDGITELQKSHDVVNAFFFGPALVRDGQVCDISKEYGWNPYGQEPRAAIGQIGPLTYAVVTVDGRIADSEGVTLPTLAAFMGLIVSNCLAT